MGVNLNDLMQRIHEIKTGRVAGATSGSKDLTDIARDLVGMQEAAESRAHARAAASGSDPEFLTGDLVEVVSPHGLDEVMLGRITPDEADEDPVVGVSTLCIVQRPHLDNAITSQPSYIVLLSLEGAPREFWLYAKEMRLVSR